MSRIVIIGASVAGVKFVQCLCAERATDEIVLVDAESEPLYDKPPLSKRYLGDSDSAAGIGLSTHDDLQRLGVATRFGTAATALDPATKRVTLDDGTELEYDSLIIATGARARRTPWADLPGVHVLRTRKDADGLREALSAGRHLAVIGAGFIGAEAAATARGMGLDVTIVEPLDAPMGRALNPEVGGIFADKHRAEGVQLRFGVSVEDVTMADGGVRLTMTDGSELHADAVLLGIGAVVNTEWLESSGLVLDNGVLCDETMAAVGAQDVHVIGDVARFTNDRHPESVRLEHWTSAVDQARLVAHNMLHPAETSAYDPTEYVWSDQYDWKTQIIGRTGAEQWSIVGAPEDGRFAVAYGDPAEPLEGAVVVNWPRALIDARRSVTAGTTAAQFLERLRAMDVPSRVAR